MILKDYVRRYKFWLLVSEGTEEINVDYIKGEAQDVSESLT